MWTAHVLTIFSEAFPGVLDVGVLGRSRKNGLWSLNVHDIRKGSDNTSLRVDDKPYGGGPGMVMRADVLARVYDSVVSNSNGKTLGVLLTPRGKSLDGKIIDKFLSVPNLIVICGRYEGVDQRIVERRDLLEVSIGNFVLAGGEVAAMALVEACVRRISGVLGNSDSLSRESFENDQLEHPHYTYPRVWEGQTVPDVLLSGNHKEIEKWRLCNSIRLNCDNK